MPVEATTVEYVYTGDGVTTVFDFPSKFTSNADIAVGLDRVEQSSGFTVAGAGASGGGTVTFTTAPTAGSRVALLRRPPASQLVDFVNGQTILEGTLDTALDKLTMVSQYLLREIQKCVRVSEFDPSVIDVLPFAETRANRLLGFSSDGKAVSVVDITDAVAVTEAVDAAAASAASAAASETNADLSEAAALAHKNAAGVSETNAATSAAAASGARDAALANGKVYPTVASGLANTPVGSYFCVPREAGGDDYIALYLVKTGPSADLVNVYKNWASTFRTITGDVSALDTVYRLKSSDGRLVMCVYADASRGAEFFTPVKVPDGTLPYTALDAAAQARLPMSTIDEIVGYLLRVKDQSGRVALAIPKDASSPIEIYGRSLSADAGGALAVETATHLIEQFKDGAGIQQLRAVAKANGTISWSTAAAKSSTGASATPDGKVLFQRGGTTYWVDPAVGIEHLARATSDLILMGDSMTAAGSGYALTMKTAYPSREVLDAGQPGQRADGIAYRFGTAGLTLAVSGNHIPTSGSVSCTPNYTSVLPDTGTVSMRVSVGGVVCNLVSAAGAFTLVPVSYPASPVALASPALCTVLSTYVTGTDPSGAMSIEQMQSGVVIIRSGRNDIGKSDFSQASVLADIAAMVAAIKPRAKAFFVLGVTNGYGDLPTTLGGNQGSEASSDTILGQISALNTALAAAWGTQFLDPLANHVALGGATNQTVNGHTYAVLNSSVLADGIHENSTGLANTTALVQAAITAKGY